MRLPISSLLATAVLMSACGGGGGGGGEGSTTSLSISGLRLTAQSHSSVSFTWSGTGAAQYRVYRFPFVSATSTKTLLAATTQTSFTDTGVGFKEAYSYSVLACRNANDPDTACLGSGPLEPFVVLPNLYNDNLYGLATPQVDSAVLAADFGLGRVGARWVFADPGDSTQTPTLDYTVRQLTSAGARVSLTALNPEDPQTNIGEIGVDGRLGVFIVGVTGSTPDKTFPFVTTFDLMVLEPLFVPAAAAIGQSWTMSTGSSTNCDRVDGGTEICGQSVVVTTRVVANTDTFAALCPRSPLASRPIALKPFKIEVTHEYQALNPAVYKAVPKQVRQFWLSPGLGYVAARRTVAASSSAPLLGTGNYCLVAASGQ